MHLDPALSTLVGALLAILIMGIILNRMKQPHVVGYLITGVILEPHVIGSINDQSLIERLGTMGVFFLLFVYWGIAGQTVYILVLCYHKLENLVSYLPL